MVSVLNAAIENGINYFDLAPSIEAPLHAYAEAFAGRRDKILTQMHFGAIYKTGEYGWTSDLDEIKEQIAWNFRTLKMDYTDFGFIHCVDDMEDLDEVLNGGIWDYMKGLKADGIIRHLGFSSHDPIIARRVLDTGLIDLFMFSINPAYDYQKGEYAIGEVAQRAALYRDCEKMGVGISVMKPFAGGQLLDEKRSLFGHALTHVQCFQYALDRPAGLNVGLINKYYDLARVGDELARNHYLNLPLHADACLHCGHCENRCPFHVKQEDRMREIVKYFAFYAT